MLAAIAESLPIALGVLFTSTPLLVVPLMLILRGDRRSLALFLLGWIVGFLLVGGLVLLVAGNLSPGGQGPPRWLDVSRVVLGLALLVMAWRQWRGRPRAGEVAALPDWMQRIDSLTPKQAAVLGFLLVAINPKNLVLAASGAATIAAAAVSPAAQGIALLVFIAVASLGLFAPWLVWLARGADALAAFEGIKTWMVRNNAVLMTVVLALLGAVVMGNGLAGL